MGAKRNVVLMLMGTWWEQSVTAEDYKEFLSGGVPKTYEQYGDRLSVVRPCGWFIIHKETELDGGWARVRPVESW